MNQFETCTSTCQPGSAAAAPGSSTTPKASPPIARATSTSPTSDNERIDEFSAAGSFIKAYGWGVATGRASLRPAPAPASVGIEGGGAGQLYPPQASPSIARATSTSPTAATSGSTSSPPPARSSRPMAGALPTAPASLRPAPSPARAGSRAAAPGSSTSPPASPPISSGDVYVADSDNVRIDEFSAAGSFIEAYGWGVADGMNQFETCTSTCQAGIPGAGAGQFEDPTGVATDSSGNVYVPDYGNARIDEFSAAGSFIEAFGWGVNDGMNHFETCTSTCQDGIDGEGAGQIYSPEGVATDSSGDVYLADSSQSRIDEYGAGGAPSTTSTSLSGGGQSGTSISVPESTAVSDTATLSGTNASTATGTVTYSVYSDSGCTTAVSTGTAQSITTPGTLPASSAVTLGTPGTYYWQASYSGDSANAASMSTCGSEVETVTSPVVGPPSALIGSRG